MTYSRIECLPLELLDDVGKYLEFWDLLRLASTSNNLRTKLIARTFEGFKIEGSQKSMEADLNGLYSSHQNTHRLPIQLFIRRGSFIVTMNSKIAQMCALHHTVYNCIATMTRLESLRLDLKELSACQQDCLGQLLMLSDHCWPLKRLKVQSNNETLVISIIKHCVFGQLETLEIDFDVGSAVFYTVAQLHPSLRELVMNGGLGSETPPNDDIPLRTIARNFQQLEGLVLKSCAYIQEILLDQPREESPGISALASLPNLKRFAATADKSQLSPSQADWLRGRTNTLTMFEEHIWWFSCDAIQIEEICILVEDYSEFIRSIRETGDMNTTVEVVPAVLKLSSPFPHGFGN